MIRYALACTAGHLFDSWFRDSASFDEQSRGGQVTCPTCGTSDVAKTIMAPSLRTSSRETDDAPQAPVALLDEQFAETRALIKALRDKVLAETLDVGRRFAEEARAIHEGSKPAQQIRGEATAREAHDLLQDGILVLPVPTLVDERN